MRLLWVPHTPVEGDGWEGCRQYHLLNRLCDEHELHVVSWRQSKSLEAAREWGRVWQEKKRFGMQHTLSLAPNFYRFLTREYPATYHLALNQRLFRKALKGLMADLSPDAVVYSSSHHWTGFPPFDVPAPIVFDYVDRSPEWVEARYIRSSAAVVAITPELAAATVRYGKPTHVIPNGVDLQRYAQRDRAQAKAKLGLGDHIVVSLIGLTCSHDLYFLEAVAAVQRRLPEARLLVVGGGPMREAIVRRAEELGIRDLIAPGQIDHREIHAYFAATDVGLYPGDDTPYYRLASPLKVIEYSAAGAQVVSSPVDMFREGWPNVRMVGADAAAFEKAILEAIERPTSPADLTAYDWCVLTRRFEQVIEEAARSVKSRGSRQAAAR
ncbi:MAG TPA: glycosyltransferase [Chthonomonadaceae bacterium]|nr:glycosyltransferase [Chthonomonadaceae bacterium]